MRLSGGTSLHVVFGQSAAGSIRNALRSVGCHERVTGCPDDLSFGPINPPDPNLRRAWVSSVLKFEYDEPAHAVEVFEAFWTSATSPDFLPVVWVCTTHATEYAGFLEFVYRMEGRPFNIIDATGVEVPTLRSPGQTFRPWSLGIIQPEQIVARAVALLAESIWVAERLVL